MRLIYHNLRAWHLACTKVTWHLANSEKMQERGISERKEGGVFMGWRCQGKNELCIPAEYLTQSGIIKRSLTQWILSTFHQSHKPSEQWPLWSSWNWAWKRNSQTMRGWRCQGKTIMSRKKWTLLPVQQHSLHLMDLAVKCRLSFFLCHCSHVSYRWTGYEDCIVHFIKTLVNCILDVVLWQIMWVISVLTQCHILILIQVRLRTEVSSTPSSTQPGFELMTSRSWQYTSCHWDACSNHLAISDFTYKYRVLQTSSVCCTIESFMEQITIKCQNLKKFHNCTLRNGLIVSCLIHESYKLIIEVFIKFVRNCLRMHESWEERLEGGFIMQS